MNITEIQAAHRDDPDGDGCCPVGAEIDAEVDALVIQRYVS